MSLLYGMHKKCPYEILSDGWIVYVVEVGDSQDQHQGIDLSGETRDRMIRIQWLFGEHGGCYPPIYKHDGFIQRIESMVRNTPDCHLWIGGNEPNLQVEGAYSPDYTAYNYIEIRKAIRSQPGHENDVVLFPPIGPWNVETGYGWIDYFTIAIDECPDIDGFAIHTYAREQTPESVVSEAKMDAPYDHLYSGFRTYRDWLDNIPDRYKHLPVYLTECNANQPWQDVNTGFVQAAYKEIDDWNKKPGTQKIHCLCLYRWPQFDKYYIKGKQGVIEDFEKAIEKGYTVGETPEMPETNYILNPTFQPPYTPQDGIGELQVAFGWRAGWDASKKRPEWRQSAADWSGAQQWFCTSDTMDSWIQQTINVGIDSIGKYFKLQVTCALESVNVGSGIGDYFASIGIDRVGDGNVNAKTVEWLTPQHQNSVGKWTELELIAPIENDWITVYIQAANRWKVSGSMFVKSAYGYVVDDPCDCPELPPVEPPEPGSCLFDDTDILDAIENAKQEVLNALGDVVKITDVMGYQRQ